ncbi:protein phosphatase 2C domain-containing protein [Nocardioides sp. R-C-SC26]|uniref:protein phosphatase 2C domain-containing protein n=1 Tax=Nocardioides sp. R-C-SC26 TaxID=2870414 RepID=UPI001E64C845|nr:protein phosphatase 2C domain-containing protein [Nocardioides sp. R-C-SC26]
MSACTACGAALDGGAAFCEACGARQGAAVAGGPGAAVTPPVSEEAAPFDSVRVSAAAEIVADSGRRPCVECGGAVDDDAYCQLCGAKQPSERDHYRQEPAGEGGWVAGVCDRGIVHHRNEDAMALLGSPTSGERAVLVVLDGVSSAEDSHLASEAGARAACEALRAPFPQGMGTAESRHAAATALLAQAVRAANDAIDATTPEESANPASATFAVAVVEGERLVVANIGDSRVYWLPDGADGVQLTVDDSVAQMQMAAGATREAAESGPQAHAITRWLGRDAPDLAPRVAEATVSVPGWVLACSDGLWNYASDPQALRAQVDAAAVPTPDPMAIALGLLAFAKGCGGRDNITVALARVERAEAPSGRAPTPPGQNALIDPTEET